MNDHVLEKLEWPHLLARLDTFGQTAGGREKLANLRPELDREQVERRWSDAASLKEIFSQGYKPPIGELPALEGVFKAASLGQVLPGEDLYATLELLLATARVHAFAQDFTEKSQTLKRFRGCLYPMPTLARDIDRAVDSDGRLKDDASPELMRLRRQKLNVRKKIEERLRALLHKSELLTYLQDDFFTMRSERYVVPMRLDGRGRVKGSILDTSDSGQTLFIEPAEIVPINDELQEIELGEKLEILRIFRDLSQKVAAEVDTIKANYTEIINLDFLSAQAFLAKDLDAGRVGISETPLIDLREARHPLIVRADAQPAVANSISTSLERTALIVSGPNAGGKTVVLKTIGLLHMMAKAGLLIPADEKSQVYLFDKIWLEMGDAQNLKANLSTFSGHILGLKPIVERAGPRDLVLLDELAVGTDPGTGTAIAQALLESLADRKAQCVITTHFDALKGLAINDSRFRNGSMEFSLKTLRPTYRLILDVPGQSFGVEVAEQIGLPDSIIARAKELRGTSVSALDTAVSQLMEAREKTQQEFAAIAEERIAAQAERGRYEQEITALKEARREASSRLKERYEAEIHRMRIDFDELSGDLKKALKTLRKSPGPDANLSEEAALTLRKGADGKLKGMEKIVQELSQSFDPKSELPGSKPDYSTLEVGTPVFVIPLQKEGQILSTHGEREPIEVEVGVLKIRVTIHDLRVLPRGRGLVQKNKKSPKTSTRTASPKAPGGEIKLVIQTSINSIDLRGEDADRAIERSWGFIDRALLRGEPAVILIHGHGHDILKRTIRERLDSHCPYDVRWRPGHDTEGGDGVTVVELSN